MADIFISYAHEDLGEAVALKTQLETKGWTVWLDRGLPPGESFREEIMSQIDAARVVVVLWSTRSIASHWVRAEAACAQGYRKLLPIAMKSVTYLRIPIPFNELHTIQLDDKVAWEHAVLQLLGRPRYRRPLIGRALLGLRYFGIEYLGLAGGGFQLFCKLVTIGVLSDLFKPVVDNWNSIAFWLSNAIAGLMGLSMPRNLVPELIFTLFFVVMAISSYGNAVRSGLSEPIKLRLQALSGLDLLAAPLVALLGLNMVEALLPYLDLVATDVTFTAIGRHLKEEWASHLAVAALLIFYVSVLVWSSRKQGALFIANLHLLLAAYYWLWLPEIRPRDPAVSYFQAELVSLFVVMILLSPVVVIANQRVLFRRLGLLYGFVGMLYVASVALSLAIMR